MKPYYTDSQIKQLLKSAMIIIDTREQENTHITDYFKRKGIETISKALNYGDYAMLIPANPDLNLPQDMISTYRIERKGSLNELVGNIAQERTRIENEFIRGNKKMTLLIENATIEDIYTGNYRSNYRESSLIGSW